MTDSYFGGSHGVPADERCRIDRPYARVARDKMQANLKSRLAAAGVTKIAGKVDAKTVRARDKERWREEERERSSRTGYVQHYHM